MTDHCSLSNTPMFETSSLEYMPWMHVIPSFSSTNNCWRRNCKEREGIAHTLSHPVPWSRTLNRDCVQSMVLLICLVLFLLVSVKLSNVLIEKTKMALQAGHGLRLTTEDAGGNVNAKWHYKERSWYGFIANTDTFTPKSDQFRISPAASPEITHHTVWRNVAFHSLLRWEIGGMSFLNLGVKGYTM